MQKKCDLYLCESVKTDRLKLLKVFDKEFLYVPDKAYVGYLGVNVDRIKLVSVVSDLRKHNIVAFSAPVEYRDGAKLPLEQARGLAIEYAKSVRASAVESAMLKSKCPPVYWIFDLLYHSTEQEKVGGVVMIDRIDGHVWTGSENEEYMYDFNNMM